MSDSIIVKVNQSRIPYQKDKRTRTRYTIQADKTHTKKTPASPIRMSIFGINTFLELDISRYYMGLQVRHHTHRQRLEVDIWRHRRLVCSSPIVSIPVCVSQLMHLQAVMASPVSVSTIPSSASSVACMPNSSRCASQDAVPGVASWGDCVAEPSMRTLQCRLSHSPNTCTHD